MTQKNLEIKHLEHTLSLIKAEERHIQDVLKNNQQVFKEASLANGDKENRVNAFSQESLWESYFARRDHEQQLLIQYHSQEALEKRANTLKVMEKNPYFARIDFTEEEEFTSLYIGIASLRNEKEDTFVVDWRSPIANLYYESELGPTFYESQKEKLYVNLILKRQFKIKDGKLLSLVDTSETIHDDFLLEILDENSSNQMKNIVATIQKAQNAIIRDTDSQVMMIEGIAGSGKTSALMQRIAYLLYTHREWLKPEQVLLFSPNHLFSEYIAEVLPSLGESQIPTKTFSTYFHELLPQFTIVKQVSQEEFLQGKKSATTSLKASLAILPYLTNYLEKITPVGPLFTNLKIKGETILAKEQIRRYYQETNHLLPLYQRIALLQTKLLKKIGGLKKDEQKKQWVKDALEEKLQEIYSANPNLSDDNQNLGKLNQKIAKQIVNRHFKKIMRQIESYSYVAFNRQYLHFLSTLPTSLLEKFAISPKDFQGDLKQIKENFQQRQLSIADAPLFVLLRKSLAPFYPEKKARFIFIDEMQDVTPLEALVLKELHENGNFTFCGDLNQQIFGNPTLVTEVKTIFPDKKLSHYQLTTSYRSTGEIMDFAESFLLEKKSLAAPRNGQKPSVYFATDASLKEKLLKSLPEKKNIRRAILTKTIQDAKDVYELLKNDLDLQLIIEEDDYFKRSLVVMPAYLAKGLEFDEVIGVIDEKEFTTDADRLVLYTILTRGMHQLELFVKGNKLPFASKEQENLYEVK